MALSENQIKLAFQVCPVWLSGAPISAPGGLFPIIAITDPDFLTINLATASPNLDDAFGAFNVVPGGTLVKQTVATYPFANQTVAGNATIFEPLEVSMIWDTPLRGPNPPKAGTSAWEVKYGTMTKLQQWLTDHNNRGGTFTVLTPSFIYQNMILANLSDVSRATNPVPQNAWRFDFVKPLIAIDDLVQAQNSLMKKATLGVPSNGQWSGLPTGIDMGVSLPQYLFGSPYALPPAILPPAS